MTVRIAKTVRTIAEGIHPLARQILDRTYPIDERCALEVVRHTQFGWPGRRPRLVTINGKRVPDMDLASFLIMLACEERETVIEFPHYRNRLPKRHDPEVRHLSPQRFGVLRNLISHNELLSFGVEITDTTVARRTTRTESDVLGAARTFMLVDYHGAWYSGCRSVHWKPTEAETKFRERHGMLGTHSTQEYAYFVHPNRRHSIFGAPYLLLKLLLMRIEDELSFYRNEMRKLELRGIHEAMCEGSSTSGSYGPITGIMVPTFTMKLQGFSCTGAYQPVSQDLEGMRCAKNHVRYLKEKLRPLVQFIVRADELAFFLHGREKEYVAPWIHGISWIHRTAENEYVHEAMLPLSSTVLLSYKSDLVSRRVSV